MKNKPLTIILLLAVVAIWAWIMYSVFDYMDSPEVRPVTNKSFVSMIHDDTVKQDYVLLLNYKDPFLKKEYYSYQAGNVSPVNNKNDISSQRVNPAQQKANQKKEIKEEVPLPVINYVGRIHNSKSNKPIAILIIDNKEYMMQEGQIQDGVLLKQIMNDSIKTIIEKKILYVKKQ